MFPGVLAASGYETLLGQFLQGLPLLIHAYCNDPALTADRVVGDFVEVAFAGYAPFLATRWTPPTLRAGVAFSVSDLIYWTFTGGTLPLPIRGVYGTYGTSGPLLFAARATGDAVQLSDAMNVLIVQITAQFPAAPG